MEIGINQKSNSWEIFGAGRVEAHRSGCHRWHSCPSDRGTYSCGDLGYSCRYPTYPEGGVAPYTTPRYLVPSPKPSFKPYTTPYTTPVTPSPKSSPSPSPSLEVKGETTQISPSPVPVAGEKENNSSNTFWGLVILGVIGGGAFWLFRNIMMKFRPQLPKTDE